MLQQVHAWFIVDCLWSCLSMCDLAMCPFLHHKLQCPPANDEHALALFRVLKLS